MHTYDPIHVFSLILH